MNKPKSSDAFPLYKKRESRRRIDARLNDRIIVGCALGLLIDEEKLFKSGVVDEKKEIMTRMHSAKNQLTINIVKDHQMYITVRIHINDGIIALFTEYAKALEFVQLLKTATPYVNRTIRIHVEESERFELSGYLLQTKGGIEALHHIDDPDYFIDELLTNYCRDFKFEGDIGEFLGAISKKQPEDVTNIEMHYLRQVRNRAIPGQEIVE